MITAIFTNKGGVAKTMLTANVAAEMAKAGARVAVIDLDPQSNLSDLLLGEQIPEGASSVDDIMAPVMKGEGQIAQVRLARSEAFGVDILPCTPRLALAEDFLAGEWRQACGADVRGLNATLSLHAAVESFAGDYDEILIDCGPMLGSLNRAGLIAADRIVSPVTRDRFCVMALDNAAEWMAGWKRNWDRIPLIMGAIRSGNPPCLPQVATFAGYVHTNASGFVRDKVFDVDLAAAAARCNPQARLFGDIPHNSVAFFARLHRVPYARLEVEHGLVGSQFAQRHKASGANAEIAEAMLDGPLAELAGPS